MVDEKEVKTSVEVDEGLYHKFFSMVGVEGKLSQAKAAKELGVSSGLISAYKSKNYTGNITALEEKIRSFLQREERRIDDVAIPIVETTTIENIRRAVEIAHDYKDIAVIVGDAGTGKTTAIKIYESASHAALVVYAYPGITQQKVLAEIARAVGAYQKGGKAVLIERIVEELRGWDVVLIIDQADYLTDASLELLRGASWWIWQR
jgi:DNA transposition AAA+ family ATPase